MLWVDDVAMTPQAWGNYTIPTLPEFVEGSGSRTLSAGNR